MGWLRAMTDQRAWQAGHGESLRPEDLAQARWITDGTPRRPPVPLTPTGGSEGGE